MLGAGAMWPRSDRQAEERVDVDDNRASERRSSEKDRDDAGRSTNASQTQGSESIMIRMSDQTGTVCVAQITVRADRPSSIDLPRRLRS